ncbi:MAG: hypothetical protein ACXWLV_12995 [Rhizomicrobium sp.]
MPITVEDIIAEAAALPLLDAAYAIWREKVHFERLARQARRLTPLEAASPAHGFSPAQLMIRRALARPVDDRAARSHR